MANDYTTADYDGFINALYGLFQPESVIGMELAEKPGTNVPSKIFQFAVDAPAAPGVGVFGIFGYHDGCQVLTLGLVDSRNLGQSAEDSITIETFVLTPSREKISLAEFDAMSIKGKSIADVINDRQ